MQPQTCTHDDHSHDDITSAPAFDETVRKRWRAGEEIVMIIFFLLIFLHERTLDTAV